MTYALVLAGLVVLALLGAWWIDHRAAKRGYRIDMRHSGLRREISVTRLDDGTELPRADRSPPTRPD